MYETLAKFAQTGGLLIFVVAFLLVLAYALSPNKKEQFEQAARIPLDEENEDE